MYHNDLVQYGRRSNVVFSSIPENLPDNYLESTVISVSLDVDVQLESRDIEAWHRIGKKTSKMQKAIVRFVNRKNCAALAITGAIKGTSQTKQYKELELESLKFRRWFRQLWTLFKVKTSGKPEYLLSLIPTGQYSYNTRSLDKIKTYYCRTNTFKNSFFSIYNS